MLAMGHCNKISKADKENKVVSLSILAVPFQAPGASFVLGLKHGGGTH